MKIDDFHLAYIGHPAFKKMGAKQAYSLANCLAFLPLFFFGINALLLSITPRRHYPAFLFGLIPIITDWAKGTSKCRYFNKKY